MLRQIEMDCGLYTYYHIFFLILPIENVDEGFLSPENIGTLVKFYGVRKLLLYYKSLMKNMGVSTPSLPNSTEEEIKEQ